MDSNPDVHAVVEISTATDDGTWSKRRAVLNTLQKTSWLLGRNQKMVDIELHHINVSGIQARINYTGAGRFEIEDLGSANGSFFQCDGERLTAGTKRVWQYGEVICFGKISSSKEKATLLRSDDLDSLLMCSEKVLLAPSSWRSRKFSDWSLKLGDETYQVHRVILGEGERHSKYFLAQFERWGESSNGITDMNNLLPEPCCSLVEPLLDYIYDGHLHLQVDNVVYFLRIAQILQIDTLCQSAISFIRACIQREKQVLQIVESCLQLNPGLEIIVKQCLPVLARAFESLSPESLARFPPEVLSELAYHLDRSVPWPSHLCRCVTEHLRSYGGNHSGDKLCRVFNLLEPLILSSRFTVCPPDALCLLSFASSFGQKECQNKCWQAALDGFTGIRLVDLQDHALVCDLLDSDMLSVASEDQVFDKIFEYCSAKSSVLSPDQLADVWATCRFVDLSPECIFKALDVEHIPSEWLKLGLAGRVTRDNRGQLALQAVIGNRDRGVGDQTLALQAKRLNKRDRGAGEQTLHLQISPFPTRLKRRRTTLEGIRAFD